MRTIVMVLAITTWARIAAADVSADDAAARDHYQRGKTFFSLGEFAAAIKEYKAAFTLRHDPVLLYNIAQAYRLANELSQAVFFYKSFLSNQPDADNRKEVEDRIKKLEEQIAQQRALVTAPPTSTVAPSPPLETKPAPPETKPAPATEPKPATAATPAPVEANPTAEKPAPVAVVATKPAPKAAQPVYKKWWLWTAVGVGVAAIAVGAGVGVALSGSSAPSTSFGNTPIF